MVLRHIVIFMLSTEAIISSIFVLCTFALFSSFYSPLYSGLLHVAEFIAVSDLAAVADDNCGLSPHLSKNFCYICTISDSPSRTTNSSGCAGVAPPNHISSSRPIFTDGKIRKLTITKLID